MAQQIKLGYWGIRGAAHVSRLLLAYTGATWQNVAYTDPNQWFANDKINLGFDFPNLPYLIDGDLKISQSSAIERYIIDRSDKKQLFGKSIQDIARVNQILGVLNDVRQASIQLFISKDYQSKLKEVWGKVGPKIQSIHKFIGEKQFSLGYLTLADFHIAEFSNYLQKLFPEQYKQYGSFQKIRDNFNNLQEIKNYYKLQNSIKGPFIPPHFQGVKI